MNCNNKTILIITLGLIALVLVFSWGKELFIYEDHKKKLETKPLGANVIETSVYNYYPIALQCPEDSKEIISWDPNTKVCKKGDEYIERECPKEMIREGDYCYMPCDEKYYRDQGLCKLK